MFGSFHILWLVGISKVKVRDHHVVSRGRGKITLRHSITYTSFLVTFLSCNVELSLLFEFECVSGMLWVKREGTNVISAVDLI